jgi:anthranilate phosphoribosyltransferase
LTLPGTGEIRAPAFLSAALLYCFFDFLNRGTETTKIAGWFQAMNSAATGTTKATEINRIRTTGKIGNNKTVPPEFGLTMRAAIRLHPGKKATKLRNILDGNGNEKYQWINSLLELLLLLGGSGGSRLKAHHSISFVFVCRMSK